MKKFFLTLNDRIIPWDRVLEIKIGQQGEKATFTKLKHDCNVDFDISINDGTEESVSLEYMFSCKMLEYDNAPKTHHVINEWVQYREHICKPFQCKSK